jgi:hypothetical protein
LNTEFFPGFGGISFKAPSFTRMPNWCENSLEVCAPSEADADAFYAANAEKETVPLPVAFMHAFLMGACNSTVPRLASGCPSSMKLLSTRLLRRIFEFAVCSVPRPNSLDFECAVPYPPEWDEAQRQQCWYQFNTTNWGTKWPASDVYAEVEGCSVTYSFSTAWSPPLEWLKTLSAKHPTAEIRMSYGEPGCDFSGVVLYENGSISGHDQGAYGEFYGERDEEEEEDDDEAEAEDEEGGDEVP